MIYLAIFLGGGLGSLLRYGTTEAGKAMIKTSMPIGTILSNVVACLLLALFVTSMKEQLAKSEFLTYFLVIGLCGGYSTFSTFSMETVNLFQAGNWAFALLNILISVTTCIVLIYLVLKTR